MQEPSNTERSFSNNLQHELGTQLSVIFACCFLLRETLREILSEEQQGQLDKIERSAERIRDLRTGLRAPPPKRVPDY